MFHHDVDPQGCVVCLVKVVAEASNDRLFNIFFCYFIDKQIPLWSNDLSYVKIIPLS